MKPKKNQRLKKRREILAGKLQQLPIGETQDLFNQVRVTWPEVELWVLIVAGIPANSWRFEYYSRGWNVAEKVKAAKISGDWPPTL